MVYNAIAQGINPGAGLVQGEQIKQQRNALNEQKMQDWAMQGLEMAASLPPEAREGWVQSWRQKGIDLGIGDIGEATPEEMQAIMSIPGPTSAPEDLIQTMGPDGKPVLTPKSEAAGMQPYIAPPKPTQPRAPVKIVGDDGKPIWATPDQAVGKPVYEAPKPRTPVKVINNKGEVEFVDPQMAMDPSKGYQPYTKETFEKAQADAKATDPKEIEKSVSNLSFLKNTLDQAKGLSGGAGASGISQFLGDTFVGDTDFRRLENKTNSLRTNVLTLMTDPSVKKFFGPQMSEADVRLMSAGGTTLDPENQSEEDLLIELGRLENLFGRMVQSIAVEGMGYDPNGTYVLTPDGKIVEIVD